MNKTISVLMCKREEYARQVLQHIEKAVGREDWKVYVYIDIPGHKSDVIMRWTKPQINHQKVIDVAKSFDFVEQVQMAPRPLGLKAATYWAIKDVFTKQKSDLNLHIEDDILISPDALKFVEDCEPYLKGKYGTATLQGYMGKGGGWAQDTPMFAEENPGDLNKVFSWPHFTCGWGWACTRKFYFSEFMRAPDQKIAASWAADILALFKKQGFEEIRSNARKSKNIGVDLTTHLKGRGTPDLLGTLNCFDVQDEWNGGNHDLIWDWDFSGLENEE